MMQLVGRIPNSEPDREAIAMQVRNFTEKAKSVLEKPGESANEEPQPAIDETSVAKLFEEVKVMFKDLPSRIEGRLDPMRRRRHRLHPMMMVDEFLHMSKEFDDPTGLLLLIGMFRDDLPWLYEVGLEFYRAIKSGNHPQMKKAHRSMMIALDMTRHGPLGEGMHDKETYIMIREMPEILNRYFERAINKPPKKLRKAPTK